MADKSRRPLSELRQALFIDDLKSSREIERRLPAEPMEAAAAMVSGAFLALSAARASPSPKTLTGVRRSIAPIHFGSWACERSFGCRCHCRAPKRTWAEAPAGEAIASMTAPSAESPRIQPTVKRGPLRRPRGVASMRMIAMIGSGLIATAAAKPSTSPRTAPMVASVGAQGGDPVEQGLTQADLPTAWAAHRAVARSAAPLSSRPRGSGCPTMATTTYSARPTSSIFLRSAVSVLGSFSGHTDTCVALLRTEAGRNPHDKDLHGLVGELSTLSEEFRTRWGAHNVRHHGTGTKRFHHSAVGASTPAWACRTGQAGPSSAGTSRESAPGDPGSEGLDRRCRRAAAPRTARAAPEDAGDRFRRTNRLGPWPDHAERAGPGTAPGLGPPIRRLGRSKNLASWPSAICGGRPPRSPSGP